MPLGLGNESKVSFSGFVFRTISSLIQNTVNHWSGHDWSSTQTSFRGPAPFRQWLSKSAAKDSCLSPLEDALSCTGDYTHDCVAPLPQDGTKAVLQLTLQSSCGMRLKPDSTLDHFFAQLPSLIRLASLTPFLLRTLFKKITCTWILVSGSSTSRTSDLGQGWIMENPMKLEEQGS